MEWIQKQDALLYGLLLLALVMIVVPRLLGNKRGRLINAVLAALAGVLVLILRPLHLAGLLFFVLAVFWFLRFWFARDPDAEDFYRRDDRYKDETEEGDEQS